MNQLGKIKRIDTFLYQLDTDNRGGINLWSGKLNANNGFTENHVLRAAVLFANAEDMVEVIKDLLTMPEFDGTQDTSEKRRAIKHKALEVLIKATSI